MRLWNFSTVCLWACSSTPFNMSWPLSYSGGSRGVNRGFVLVSLAASCQQLSLGGRSNKEIKVAPGSVWCSFPAVLHAPRRLGWRQGGLLHMRRSVRRRGRDAAGNIRWQQRREWDPGDLRTAASRHERVCSHIDFVTTYIVAASPFSNKSVLEMPARLVPCSRRKPRQNCTWWSGTN